MTDQPSQKAEDYKSTVFLPVTDFPMKAGLAQKEPAIAAKWEAMDLYGKLREKRAGRERFILHDGPPYANGDIHMGHAMNKVLKDIIVRSQSLLGKDAPYVPGWDCHGLPIEWKIEEEYRKKKLNKDEVPPSEFRAQCRAYADKWVGVQKDQFKRLGVMGDWADPYLTMKFDAEATIVGELLKFAASGQLYRGAKPVMWSPVEKTALAEAEVEYEDITSTQIDVAFEIVEAPNAPELVGAHAVIWTTTPWTIPVNQALAYGEEVEYVLFRLTGAESVSAHPGDFGQLHFGRPFLIAEPLLSAFYRRGGCLAPRGDVLWRGKGSQLAGAVARHPMHHLGGFFAGDGPGVEQVQVAVGFWRGDVIRVGQAGHGVFGGEAGNVVGRLHGLQNGPFREVRGAGIAPAMPQVHGHPQRLVAVAFDVFKFALAHADTEPAALGGLRASVGGTELERMRQGGVHQVFKGFTGVAEAAGGRCLGFLHSGGYDTCRSGSPVALTPDTPNMSRKPKKGYFVRGQFVAEGSELDLQLKAELKGTDEASKTELKRESTALQKLGEDLLTLRADLMEKLPLSDKLVDAVAEAKRITNFEGKRRQMQYVGKLMRKLEPELVQAARQALEEQHKGSASEKLSLHLAEHWRDRLIADDAALAPWMAEHPDTDTQQLRALIRQARKDATPAGKTANVQVSEGLAPRKGRAYRELFQLVREHLGGAAGEDNTPEDEDHDE